MRPFPLLEVVASFSPLETTTGFWRVSANPPATMPRASLSSRPPSGGVLLEGDAVWCVAACRA